MANYTAIAVGGDWSNNATWGGSGHPTSGDTAIIDSTMIGTVTVDTASACAILNCTGCTGTLTLGANLDIYGTGSAVDVLILASGMTFTPSTYKIKFIYGGKITSNGKEFYQVEFAPGGTNRSYALQDAMTVNSTLTFTTSGGTVGLDNATINAKGDVTKTDTSSYITYSSTLCTLNINGSGNQTIQFSASATSNFTNIVINSAGGTVTFSGNIQNSGNLTYTAGTVDFGTSHYSTIGSSTFNFSTPTNCKFYQLSFQPNVARTITLSSDIYVTNTLTFNTTSAQITLSGIKIIYAAGDIVRTGDSGGSVSTTNTSLTINGSGNQAIDFGGATATPWYLSVTINSSGGIVTFSSSIWYHYQGTITYTAGTVDCSTNTSTLRITSSCTLNTNGINWYNITLSGNATTTLTSDLNLTAKLNASSTDTINGNYNINIGGDFSHAQIYGTSTIVLNGTGVWTCTDYADINVTINTAGTITISGYVVTGTLYYRNKTLTYIAGTVIVPAILHLVGSGILNTNGISWNDINLASGTTTLSSNIDINGDFIITGTLDAATKQINIAKNYTINGTQSNTGKIVLDGTGIWSGTGTTIYDLEINTVGTITISGTIKIGINITGCILTYTLGTVVTTGSTLNLVEDCSLNCSGITWNHIDIAVGVDNEDIILLADLKISGNFNNPSEAVPFSGNYTITFNGTSGIQTIDGTTTFPNLKLETGDKTVEFQNGITFTVTGLFTIVGTSGHLITIQSDNIGNQFNLMIVGSCIAEYLNIKDCNANLGKTIIAINETNSGNNNNIEFERDKAPMHAMTF